MTNDLARLLKTIEEIIKLHAETPTIDYQIIQALPRLSKDEKILLTEIIPQITNNRVTFANNEL